MKIKIYVQKEFLLVRACNVFGRGYELWLANFTKKFIHQFYRFKPTTQAYLTNSLSNLICFDKIYVAYFWLQN